jgi:hypothetical protein
MREQWRMRMQPDSAMWQNFSIEGSSDNTLIDWLIHSFSTQLTGLHIKDFYLESNRVVQQSAGERNFHIFYDYCAGLGTTLRSKFGIKSSANYFYLNQVFIHSSSLSSSLTSG